MRENVTPIELFHARSIVDNFPTRWGPADHVQITWFVESRPAPLVLYETVIPGYPHDRSRSNLSKRESSDTLSTEAFWAYDTSYVDELFSQSEVEALRSYLTSFPATTFEVQRAELPIPSNVIGLGCVSVGGPTDFYMLNKIAGYSLDFPVWGYYELDREGVRFHHERPAHFEYELHELLLNDVRRPS